MSTKLKLYLGRKVIECLRKTPHDIAPNELKSLIQIGKPPSENFIEMNVPVNVLEMRLGVSSIKQILKILPDDIIQNIQCIKDQSNKKISFEINRNIFVKEVIENCTIPDINFQPKSIVVEYSSPNIAKPFHVGHLRSTIIGNFIANINSYLNNRVTRLNYIGDWGTQFGFILVGIEKLNYSSEDIKKNPMKLLYDSYVHANKLAETDPSIAESARTKFSNLEYGVNEDLHNWETYIKYTITDLQKMYNRLGVKFDEYNFESMYKAKDIQDVIDTMNEKQLLQTQIDGKQTVSVNDRTVSVIKSDGSTLYLTRDIAAAIDRFKKYNFDQMYYVVENGQNDHFNAFKDVLHRMDYPWANRIKHVKFGRIRGMSTRKGKVVFLKDILNESRDLMIQKQIESPNTKVSMNDVETSDVLGVSSVIINDLKQRRQKDYEFSWDRVLQVQGETGIKLQYTHCRLCNLEKYCGILPAQVCKPEFLEQPAVTSLVRELACFHDVLNTAQEQLEACVLVKYLFQLCNHINRAFKILKVKDQEPELAAQRLLLFTTARDVLGQGMTILGLKPLTNM